METKRTMGNKGSHGNQGNKGYYGNQENPKNHGNQGNCGTRESQYYWNQGNQVTIEPKELFEPREPGN